MSLTAKIDSTRGEKSVRKSSIVATGAHDSSRINRDFSWNDLLIFRFFRSFGPKNSNYDMTLMELFGPNIIEALLEGFRDLDFWPESPLYYNQMNLWDS